VTRVVSTNIRALEFEHVCARARKVITYFLSWVLAKWYLQF